MSPGTPPEDDWIDETIGFPGAGGEISDDARALRALTRAVHDIETERAALLSAGFYARLEAKARARGLLQPGQTLQIPSLDFKLELAEVGDAMRLDEASTGLEQALTHTALPPAQAAAEAVAPQAPPSALTPPKAPQAARPSGNWGAAVRDWFGVGHRMAGSLLACALVVAVMMNVVPRGQKELVGWRGDAVEVLMWTTTDPVKDAKSLIGELAGLDVQARVEDAETTRIVSTVIPESAAAAAQALFARRGIDLQGKSIVGSVQIIVRPSQP